MCCTATAFLVCSCIGRREVTVECFDRGFVTFGNVDTQIGIDTVNFLRYKNGAAGRTDVLNQSMHLVDGRWISPARWTDGRSKLIWTSQGVEADGLNHWRH